MPNYFLYLYNFWLSGERISIYQFLKNMWIVERSNFVMIFTDSKNVWNVE